MTTPAAGHAEGERANGADDVLNEYKHRCDHTQDNQSPPARHKIGEPGIDADGGENH